MRQPHLIRILPLIAAGALSGCAGSEISPQTENPEVPVEWTRGGDQGTVDLNWLDDFGDPLLTSLVSEAVLNNYQLAQERARVYQAEQTVLVSRSNRLPSLDA